MSRIGKSPIILDQKVNITIKDKNIIIEGPKGQLKYILPSEIEVEHKEKQLFVYPKKETKLAKQLHGLSRTIINNMTIGVSKGFCKKLEIQGIGYRAQTDNKGNLILNVGYSHSINIVPPAGIKISVENNTEIKIQGINKEIVGQLAAEIRSIRPPEPYKGKGIRYSNESIRKKVGKAGK